MTTSRRVSDRKVARFERKLMKKGSEKKGWDFNYLIGPILIGFLVFVLAGLCLFQIIRRTTAASGTA
ncbi:unnamed protein product [Lathyrus oleraceus]